MVKVRQIASPVSPGCTVAATVDQSVAVNGSGGIFMSGVLGIGAICEKAERHNLVVEEIGRRVARPIGPAGDYKGHGGAKFHVDFPLGTVAQPVSTLQVSAPGET
jgi:hypothetical protein